jgi:3-hydroxyacyl-[acyl-carrier-protein] dehydratase
LLLNNLYTIQSVTELEKTIQTSVMLRAEHAIFKGHFPGQPVLPGVCMIEMISEIIGTRLKTGLRIKSAPLIKFLYMIDPGKDPLIHFEIKYDQTPDGTSVQGRIFSDTRVFMKFQMMLESAKKN